MESFKVSESGEVKRNLQVGRHDTQSFFSVYALHCHFSLSGYLGGTYLGN